MTLYPVRELTPEYIGEVLKFTVTTGKGYPFEASFESVGRLAFYSHGKEGMTYVTFEHDGTGYSLKYNGSDDIVKIEVLNR